MTKQTKTKEKSVWTVSSDNDYEDGLTEEGAKGVALDWAKRGDEEVRVMRTMYNVETISTLVNA